MLPLGIGIYIWLFVKAFLVDSVLVLNSNEEIDTWKLWMMGPVRRAIVGTFIYANAVVWSSFPAINVLTSIFFAFWSVADYYDYEYDWDTFTPTSPNYYPGGELF